jgi:hypothetical protein
LGRVDVKRSTKVKLVGGAVFLVFMGVAYVTQARAAAVVSWSGWLVWFLAALYQGRYERVQPK